MASEKSQNPFETLGYHAESDDPSIPGPSNSYHPNFEPPPYTTTTPATETETETSRAFEPQQQNFYPPPSQFQPPPSQGYPTNNTNNPNKPIAIPATAPTNDSPFIRAYAPLLAQYNLPRESFLSFLDGLNKVVATSPPLQVLDATGGILQSVPILFPLHWIGSAVSGLANLGSQGVSKSRTDSAIKQANKDIFGPRGLKVEIAKLDALAHVAGIPVLDSQGKVSKQTPLLQRLIGAQEGYGYGCGNGNGNRYGHAAEYYAGGGYGGNGMGPGQGQMQMQGQGQELDAQQRRVRMLQPWIADLEMEILPWTTKSKLTRFNAALKKRNNAGQPESSDRASSQVDDEETAFRKCLWLIIRPLDGR